ncbi:MAG TPA: monofunctional biosynthetic peptidoglycan transglycosylase [Caldithrix abyssi]|uniref:Monofunctional biosynthetic peptidoglycan transglycosylase n=1 Tax=Caldithrix abyssi TaxID=187145 RepID=A0A7V4WTY7_CALAY|nr:monofunctional biosynthetic peptidoglycan transglycosylase [Caldithrix abyssi]
MDLDRLRPYLKIRYLLPGSLLVLFLLFLLWLLMIYISLPDVSALVKKNPKTTALIQQRIQEAKQQGKKLRINQRWVRFKRIPKLLRQAVRVSEDASFYLHEGVDYTELKESFKKNWEKGEITRGGSTITQQLAKNLYLSTERSYLRKIKEYFIAKRLEATLSKYRIFHLYLNIIELGPGVFGVQAASRYYFGKNVEDLTLGEMVRIAAVIPKPLKVRANGNSRWLRWKARWILHKLLKYGYINQEQYDETIDEFE